MGAALRLVVRCAAGRRQHFLCTCQRLVCFGKARGSFLSAFLHPQHSPIAYGLVACCPFGRSAAARAAVRAQVASVVVRHVLRRRRRRRAAAAMYQCTVKVRRNSWQPKPRHGDPESDVKYRQWWHDSSKSEWWALFEDPNTSPRPVNIPLLAARSTRSSICREQSLIRAWRACA